MGFWDTVADIGTSFLEGAVNAFSGDKKPFETGSGWRGGVQTLGQLAMPLVVAGATKPSKPKFPEIPSSVKNDPRVQHLLNPYGFPNNFPSIDTPSVMTLALPYMLNTGAGYLGKALAKEEGETAKKSKLPTGNTEGQTTKQSTLPTGNTEGQTTKQSTLPTGNTEGQNIGDRVVNSVNSEIDTMYNQTPKSMSSAVNKVNTYSDAVSNAVRLHGGGVVDEPLVKAVIMAESSGNPIATPKNKDGTLQSSARGLMQMTKAATKDVAGFLNQSYDHDSMFDPNKNIEYGTRYLQQMVSQITSKGIEANLENVIQAYHDGIGTVLAREAPSEVAKEHIRRVKQYRNYFSGA